MHEGSENLDWIVTGFVERVSACCGFSSALVLDIWAMGSFLRLLDRGVSCSADVLGVGRDLLARQIGLGLQVGCPEYAEIMYGAYEAVCRLLAERSCQM